MIIATADFALLILFIFVCVCGIIFLPTTVLTLLGRPGRYVYNLITNAWYEHNLRSEELKQAKIATALLEEQLRNEQLRSFVAEKPWPPLRRDHE